jgi:hypothetical protein
MCFHVHVFYWCKYEFNLQFYYWTVRFEIYLYCMCEVRSVITAGNYIVFLWIFPHWPYDWMVLFSNVIFLDLQFSLYIGVLNMPIYVFQFTTYKLWIHLLALLGPGLYACHILYDACSLWASNTDGIVLAWTRLEIKSNFKFPPCILVTYAFIRRLIHT